MAGKPWTDGEDAVLRALYADTQTNRLTAILGRSDRSIYSRANTLGLQKSAAYLASEHAKRLTSEAGKETRFQKGMTPWNSGIKGWVAGGRSAETRFKPGSKPHTWLPIGSERISKDGYLQRKATDTGYPPRDWVGVHILLWREHHGEIPAGHIVVFRDRNKHNIDIDNLELISRAENCRRNSIHRYPPELKAGMRTLARLKRAIQEKEHEESRRTV